jgi:hypothetical protein
MTTIYPRFLGVDGSGDFVWELADGRWTWGDDPHAASTRERTFEPERYIGKYGRPIGLTETIDRKAEADEDPAQFVNRYAVPTPDETTVAGEVLCALLAALDGWIEGARENHDALGHRGENRGEECWTQWHPSDFRSMVNDVASQFGVPEFPRPEVPKEIEVR